MDDSGTETTGATNKEAMAKLLSMLRIPSNVGWRKHEEVLPILFGHVCQHCVAGRELVRW